MTHPTTRIQEIFDRVVGLPADERANALAEACAGDDALHARVSELLDAHDAAHGFLDAPTANTPALADTAPIHEKPGDTIGRYKLLEEIGEGGFGRVFLAEQREPVRRLVALKIIKLGMDTRQVIARFEVERQALAMMDHPGIARVFDAATTDTGRPYFVMELVRGVPITQYADANNLSTSERLGLFERVCRAVQHAHTKGVIHRDLKPSNILVTLQDDQPAPKVIDFGIAKATNQRLTERTLFTEFRQFVGTPEYVSPEQATMSNMDVDTRADVYSLGVLLYELLVGATPLDSTTLRADGFDAMQRMIRDHEPPRPSTRFSTLGAQRSIIARHRSADPDRLSKALKGELDWIVMKAIDKNRSRRYETASALADDITRHRNNEPVLAGPPSTTYRLRKLLRRHRVPVAVAAAFTLLLLAALAGTSWGLITANREATQARRQQAITNEILETSQIWLRETAAEMRQLAGPDAAPDPDHPSATANIDMTFSQPPSAETLAVAEVAQATEQAFSRIATAITEARTRAGQAEGRLEAVRSALHQLALSGAPIHPALEPLIRTVFENTDPRLTQCIDAIAKPSRGDTP